jgi:electron transport complex protein RnfB
MKESKNKYQSRRDFVRNAGKALIAVPLVAIPVVLAKRISAKGYVWQIDPLKCTQCGQCKTNCVLTPSASKCFMLMLCAVTAIFAEGISGRA